MEMLTLSGKFSVSPQLTPADLASLQQQGVEQIICNRPDGESGDQPGWQELAEIARSSGLSLHYLPVVQDTINSSDVRAFAALLQQDRRTHAYCRSGARSTVLWALSQIFLGRPVAEVLAETAAAGKDLGTLPERYAGVIAELTGAFDELPLARHCPVLIVGGGAAGISLAASLLRRAPDLDISIIEPSQEHYYQPGFTLVGAGVFRLGQTRRDTAALIPEGVSWIPSSVTNFLPERNQLVLDDGVRLSYDQLCVCAGLKLNWAAVQGLEETLGKNGVTSNYRPDLAPYTWQLVQQLESGRAVFTQPPMPIKCAGAPQKAMYLSADHWLDHGVLKNIEVCFYNAGAVLFGVKDYVPALQHYVERYNARLHLGHNLVRVDGPNRLATFVVVDAEGNAGTVETHFDMLHVCPPQCAPDFIRNSPLADRSGWVQVNPETLQHVRYPNVWGLGDVTSTPNAKTAAAVRKQAPIVASNLLADIRSEGPRYAYDGYGACPLTVEKGKIVLAEFSYGGKLQPSLPQWLLQGTRPTRLAWWLKKSVMPLLYWRCMLKGRELLAQPQQVLPETETR